MEGTATTFAFGTREVVSTWKPMKLPKSQDIEETVASMNGTNFGMNVVFPKQKEETEET